LIKPASGKLDFFCTFQHAGSQAWFTNVYGFGEAVRVLLNHGLVVGGVITGTAPSPDAVSIGARGATLSLQYYPRKSGGFPVGSEYCVGPFPWDRDFDFLRS
jgi:hypothetical protein